MFEHDLLGKPVSTLGSMSEGKLFPDHAVILFEHLVSATEKRNRNGKP
jgi:hypothetical protein